MDILATIWLMIIGFAIMMYIVLDGFDLGIGILFPLVRDPHHKQVMLTTILPVWDGNETWLVFGGASLYGAFPAAFAIMLPFFYLPLLIMVIALLLRGVVFEFYMKEHRNKKIWNISFFVGSLVATLCQGLILGTFVQGFALEKGFEAYSWFSPLSVFTACALVFGYALLGATWLIGKTRNALQEQMRKLAVIALIVVGACMAIVSLWTPFISSYIEHRWFHSHFKLYLYILPLLGAIAFFGNMMALQKKNNRFPFYLSILLFAACYIGFVVSVWPYIVPFQIVYQSAASPHFTLVFMLIGAAIMLPILLAYTWYAYRIFRGPVHDVMHY